MARAAADDVRSTVSAELDWRGAAAALSALAGGPSGAVPLRLQVGDAVLEVVSDHAPLREELEAVYGDCVPREGAAPAGVIRCRAGLLPEARLLGLAFDGDRVPDPLDVARGPYRFLRRPPYVEAAGPGPGWRQLLGETGDLLLASDGRRAVVNLQQAPSEFVVDVMVGVAQSAQRGVRFLHAGSIGVRGSGALLIGPTRGGKSTTALALARQGHAFLGDDMAAVRLATRELLPFPKSAGVREGPLARSLGERLTAGRHAVSPGRFGLVRTLVRVGDLFPGSIGGPVPLRFAFVLDGFAEQATSTPYVPRLEDLERLKSLVTDTTASWGLSPGRDLLNFLSVVRLLEGVRCHLVQLGTPDETAALIAGVMEEPCTST